MKLIKADYIVPINKSPINDGYILFDKDKILYVGKKKPEFKNMPVKNYDHAVILPGLVNSHAHLNYSAISTGKNMRLLPWVNDLISRWQKLSDIGKKRSASIGARMMLESGVTCIADSTYEGYSVDALIEHSLKGIIFVEFFGFDERVLEEALIKKKVWEKKIKNNLLKVSLSPHATYTTSGKLIKEASDLMGKMDLPISIHAVETEEELKLFKKGETGPFKILSEFKEPGFCWNIKKTTPIKFLTSLGLKSKTILNHCVAIEKGDIDVLKSAGFSVVHCPRSNALLGSGVSPVTSFIESGILVSLGTDSLASNTNYDFFEEMRASLVIQRAMGKNLSYDSETILKMATINGAESLSLKDVGSLEAGKKADFVIIDLGSNDLNKQYSIYDRIVMGSKKEHIIEVFINGDSVYQNDKYPKIK